MRQVFFFIFQYSQHYSLSKAAVVEPYCRKLEQDRIKAIFEPF